jgi:hypothetical protein
VSYCRFGWGGSDVYVFLSVSGCLECCGCRLSEEWSYSSTDAMLAHLREHVSKGDTVPDSAIRRLEDERYEIDAYINESARASGDALPGPTQSPIGGSE